MEAIATRAGVRQTPESDLDSILFEHLFEQSQDAIVLLDASDRVVRVNAAFEELFGFRPTECLGRSINTLIVDPGFRHEARAVSRQVLDGKSVRLESLRKTRDGRLMQVEISGVPIRGGDGRLGLFGMYRDISDRRSAEGLLAQSEARYRRIVESLIDGYFELDLNGALVFGNKALSGMLGAAGRPGPAGQLLARVCPRWRRPVARHFLRLMRDDPRDGALAFDGLDRHDRERCFECMISVIRDSEGAPTGFRGTLRDVSQRVRADAEIADREAAYRTMARATGQLVYEYDIDSGRIQWLGALEAVLGADDTDSRGVGIDEWARRIHPDDREHSLDLLARAVQECGNYHAEYRFRRQDGEWIDVVDRGSVLVGDADRPPRMIGTMSDVTQRNREHAALAQTRMQAQITLDSISDAVIRTCGDGRVEYLNPSARALVGMTPAEVLGRPLHDVLRLERLREDGRGQPIELRTLAGGSSGERGEYWLRGHDGGRHEIELSIAPLDHGAAGRGHVVVFRDVSERREAAREIEWQAEHDWLTGLFNRRKFEHDAAKILDEGGSGAGHCLLYMDLDQFKLVNDSCGHHAGDQLLRELAELLRRHVRGSDLFARLGGDEFALLLRDCPIQRAREIASTLVETVDRFEFDWRGHRYRIGISIGLVAVEPAMTLAAALQAADQACYMAKDHGRNRVSEYRREDAGLRHRGNQARAAVEVVEALDEQRFRLYHQRIQCLNDGAGATEILLRMLARDGTVIGPSEFIPGAERFNKIAPLDRWVIRSVFTVLADADRNGQLPPDHRYSINLSGATFCLPETRNYVTGEFETTGLDPSRICFEINESSAIARISEAKTFMEQMRELGCSIWLDDFGSGLSSFSYLKMLPIDGLKIDGSLIHDLRQSHLGRAMVAGITEIARAAGIPCVAEQVEDVEDIDVLRELGVNAVQGFHIHRPEPWSLATISR